MEILEKIEPITEDIERGTSDLREILDDLKTYAATFKSNNPKKFLNNIIEQIKDIADDIDDSASAIYSIAEDTDVEAEKDERLLDEVAALRAVLRDYIGGSISWQEQNYIKSHYGVDITAYK